MTLEFHEAPRTSAQSRLDAEHVGFLPLGKSADTVIVADPRCHEVDARHEAEAVHHEVNVAMSGYSSDLHSSGLRMCPGDIDPRLVVHEKRIEIRWRDLDAFQHVNNAVYATYLEECRDEWAERALGDAGELWGFVLARVAIDFRQSIGANDPLRTGAYGKTLTFTLSTDQP